MRKQGVLLAATIMNAIEAIVLILFTILISMLRNDPSFVRGFSEGFGDTSENLSSIINVVIIIFVVMCIFSAIKFLFTLLGYSKSSKGFVTTALVLSAFSVAGCMFFAVNDLFFMGPLLYVGISLALIIVGLTKLNKKDDVNVDFMEDRSIDNSLL